MAYSAEGNLCLSGGIKLRDGFLREVRGNVTVNNTLHPHVWPANSTDVVESNIFFVPYRPVRPRGWGRTIDRNLLHGLGGATQRATELQALSGKDEHSLTGDALFVDASVANFALQANSPAFSLGFKKLPTHFGVQSQKMRRLARIPDMARWLNLEPVTLRTKRRVEEWSGTERRSTT